jgi:hypothetical protein
MVLAYAVMGSGVWLLPFFMPWFAYLPLLLAVLFTYRYVLEAHSYTESYWERRLQILPLTHTGCLTCCLVHRRVSTTVDKYYEPNHNPLIITPPRKVTLAVSIP